MNTKRNTKNTKYEEEDDWDEDVEYDDDEDWDENWEDYEDLKEDFF